MTIPLSIALGISVYAGGWLLAYFIDEPKAWITMIVITIAGIIFGIVYGISTFFLANCPIGVY